MIVYLTLDVIALPKIGSAISKGPNKPSSRFHKAKFYPSRVTSTTKVLASITPRFRRIRQKSELLPIVFLSNLLLNIGTLQEKRRIHKNDQQQAASLSSHKLTSV